METILTDIPFYGTKLGDFLTGWKRITRPTHEALQSELRKAKDYLKESNPDCSDEKLKITAEREYTKGLAFKFKKTGLTQTNVILRTIYGSYSDYSPEKLTLERGTIPKKRLKELTELF